MTLSWKRFPAHAERGFDSTLCRASVTRGGLRTLGAQKRKISVAKRRRPMVS